MASPGDSGELFLFGRMDHFRAKYKPRDERHSDVTDYWRPDGNQLRGGLPDVLEDAACMRVEHTDDREKSNKRRSLFRSMSLIVSRNCNSNRSSKRCSLSSHHDDSPANSPIKTSQSKTSLSRELSSDSIKLVKNSFTMFSTEFYQLPTDLGNQLTPNLHRSDSDTNDADSVSLNRCLPSNIRASSPVKITHKSESTRSLRRRTLSLDNSLTISSSHQLILTHVHDLLCLRLPPTIIYTLHSVGLISSEDYVFTDSPVTVDTFLTSLSQGTYEQFQVFLDVCRHTDELEEETVILDAMVNVCKTICDITEDTNSEIAEHPLLDDENKLSFDVGFLDPINGCLIPVVKLGENKSSKSPKNYFRLSVHNPTNNADFSEFTSKQKKAMFSIYISGYNLNGKACKSLALVIEKCSCILELNMSKNKLKSKDFENICGALRHNRSICSLDVRLNDIGDEGAAKLGAVLRRSCGLKLLNLSSTGIEFLGCKYLCQGLQINACLRDLDMSFVDVSDEGCVHISDMLTKNCSITRLRLRSNNIGWAGCALVFESLAQNKTLEELDLSRNNIGNKGVEAMCLHLPKNTSLLDLNIENCGITINNCDSFNEALRLNTTLRRLDLSVNHVGDSGVANLRSIITNTKSLECLGLNMCGITTAGFMGVLDSLESNKSITLLKLCYNRIGRDSGRNIAPDDVRFRLHCVKSSKPKLKLLLWGNVLEDNRNTSRSSVNTSSMV